MRVEQMSKTYELRKIILPLLEQSKGKAYYELASDKAVYPYKVYSFGNIDLGDISRDDLILVVDIWGKDNMIEVEEIADSIEKIFNCLNAPTTTSFPTFYRISRNPIEDEDKTIKRRQLKFQIQNYYVE
jgi:hypothetical protein